MRKRTKLTDVARRANVSTAVVSKVVNNKPGSSIRVSPETESRVLAAVRELGYVPNPVARSLALGQNRILGVFTHESIFPVDQQSFYHPFLLGIEEESEKQGYDLLLFTSTHTPDGKRRIYNNGMNRLQVANGSILIGREKDKSEITQLLDDGYPFVHVGRRSVPNRQIVYSAADYAAATSEVVRYLFDFGHRKILMLGSQNIHEPVVDRQQGFEAAYRSCNFPLVTDYRRHVLPEALTIEQIEAWFRQGITAFVVEDDMLAKPLIRLAEERGLRPPRDFSLAVLGDPLESTEDVPDWTTFKIPRRDMGRHAVRLLIEILEAKQFAARSVTLPCTFVKGQTSGPLRPGGRV